MSAFVPSGDPKDNPWANYFTPNQPFTLKHKQTFLEELSEYVPKYMSQDRCDVLTDAVIKIKSTNDPVIGNIRTLFTFRYLLVRGKMSRAQMDAMVDEHMDTWLAAGNVSFLVTGLSGYCCFDCLNLFGPLGLL